MAMPRGISPPRSPAHGAKATNYEGCAGFSGDVYLDGWSIESAKLCRYLQRSCATEVQPLASESQRGTTTMKGIFRGVLIVGDLLEG
jgi:hypothetical protein